MMDFLTDMMPVKETHFLFQDNVQKIERTRLS